MNAKLLTEYQSIVRQIEISPTREGLQRLFEMVDENFHPAMHTLSVCFKRGILVEQNDDTAFEYCKAAASLGNGPALNNMGINYLEGKHVAQDSDLALRYFSSAMQSGFVAAMHNSAYVVDHGLGVVADGGLALKRYTWAYEHGYTPSANNLGLFYARGRHVQPDLQIAQIWFEKGALGEDELAKENLELVKDLRRCDPKNIQSEIRRYARIWIEDGLGF